ncbi:MAG: Coenzyme F420 hydrogenase/dehydrogenase, beta subunit C-terminal domain [Promethearchaeia archaeon]
MKVEKSSQDLENEVIYADLCIHCGSCNAFCPHMDFDEETGEPYVVDECAETIGLCYNSCPRSFLAVSEIEEKLFGETRVDLTVGVYKDIVQVESENEEDILTNMVTAAFKAGIVKHMVLSEKKSKKPPLSFPKIVDTAEDAKEYIPDKTMDNAGPLVTGIGKAYLDRKKEVGILGNPCHLQGLAKILTSDFNTGARDTVSLRIGFACSSGGMAGCRYCTDYSAEFSDISYSPWGAPKGEALLIIRSEVGQELLDTAIDEGLLKITDKSPDLSEMKEFINRKRRKNFESLIGSGLISAGYLKLNLNEVQELLREE